MQYFKLKLLHTLKIIKFVDFLKGYTNELKNNDPVTKGSLLKIFKNFISLTKQLFLTIFFYLQTKNAN